LIEFQEKEVNVSAIKRIDKKKWYVFLRNFNQIMKKYC